MFCVKSRSNKKVMELKKACFNQIKGLLIADKMGEVGFINMANVDKLPSQQAIQEECKELNLPEGELPPFVENNVYKTLYGHQESCMGLELSNDSRFVASCDTLNKINVAPWPNVFNLQSVMLEHTLAIRYMCLIGSELVASLSEPNPSSKKQDFFLSKVTDASIVYQ